MTNMVQIEKVYQANEEIKEDDVKQMMDWVDRQPHFPKVTGKLEFKIKQGGVEK